VIAVKTPTTSYEYHVVLRRNDILPKYMEYFIVANSMTSYTNHIFVGSDYNRFQSPISATQVNDWYEFLEENGVCNNDILSVTVRTRLDGDIATSIYIDHANIKIFAVCKKSLIVRLDWQHPLSPKQFWSDKKYSKWSGDTPGLANISIKYTDSQECHPQYPNPV